MKFSRREIHSEWQANYRLRLMVSIIAVTLMAYLILGLHNIRQEKVTQLSQQQHRLALITAMQNEPEWYDREKEAASHRVKFQNQLWQATSRGLAQAEMQAFLRTIIDSNKLSNSRITLETVEIKKSTTEALPIWKVSAQLRASFRSNELQKVLWAISSSPRLITIRSLNFTLNPNRNSYSNFTLFVDAWFDASTGGQKQ